MIRFTVLIEKTPDGGYGAYVPDLPGCIGMGSTKDELIENIAEAIRLHLEGLKEEGMPVPKASTEAECLILAIA